MAITVHAGDFLKGAGSFNSGTFTLRTPAHRFAGEAVPAGRLVALEVASEESVKRLGGTVGWGLAGAALFGPVGLLAGLLAGGRKREVTFVAQFCDGRKLIATADGPTFTAIQAAFMDAQVAAEKKARREAARQADEDPNGGDPWAWIGEQARRNPPPG
jgi:hypothetical protein